MEPRRGDPVASFPQECVAEHKKTFGEPLEKLEVEIRAMREQARPEGGQPS
jgi:hypothetical protein